MTVKTMIAVCLTLISLTTAGAHAAGTSSLSCWYNEARGGAPAFSFQTAPGVDLRDPLAGRRARTGTIPLKARDGSIVDFQVMVTDVPAGREVIFARRDPFFVNDISLRLRLARQGLSTFDGTYTTDYPPVRFLSCRLGV